jgi:hypothetical protein
MLIRAKLPLDRWDAGTLTVEDEAGLVVFGPVPCRGKGDNDAAAAHGNPARDPKKPFGDHPYGSYAIELIQKDKLPEHSYGPFFLLLTPTGGDALEGAHNGRTGLALHGGELTAYNVLRATNGCLRLRNEDVAAVAAIVQVGDVYICEPA